jgi:PAS domain S-box-containing protein
MALKIPSSDSLSRLPWFVRFLFGCCMASGAVGLTSAIAPLRSFPLLLGFPTVILAAWYLGMWGAAGCSLMDIALVDAFLTRTQFRFSTGNASEAVRLGAFLVVTLLLSWSMRRLAQQRAELVSQELKTKLELAESERRLAEERAQASERLRYQDDVLQIALKASGTALWAWDFEKEIVHRSDEVYRMVGCEPGAFGSEPGEWLRFVYPEDVPALDEAFAKARSEGADYHMQYRVRWPDGSEHWLESQGKCQRNAEGKVVRIYGVMADITRRKQAEEAMLRAEKLAVAGRLAASVAHEINNPLEAIANMLYLIGMSESQEESRARASQALEQLMRVSMMVQSTLMFHRETGAAKETLLSEVLDSVLDMFRSKLENLEIAVEMKAGQECPVVCMPGETQQIFANLIANSIEAMQQNGRLTVRVRPSIDWRDRASRGMRVTIRDTGAGIDRATMAHIFEPFFTTKNGTGTGLGLWVVHQLLERQRGSVHVWSSLRQGSSGSAFSVFLPFGAVDKRASTAGRGDPLRKAPEPESPVSGTGLFLRNRHA